MKSISTDCAAVKELYHIIHVIHELKTCHCYMYSSLASHLFLSERDKTYVINGKNHSVLFDGKDTWDFKAGFVLRNYMFPAKNIPNYEDIPEFVNHRIFIPFDTYLNDYYIPNIGQHMNINTVKGFYNGTKKT